jgi:hypothetical protein
LWGLRSRTKYTHVCLCRDAPPWRLYDEQGRTFFGVEESRLGNLSIGESEGGAGVQVVRTVRPCTGRLEIAFPPQYDHTWQLTTARLLIQLLINAQTLKRGNV